MALADAVAGSVLTPRDDRIFLTHARADCRSGVGDHIEPLLRHRFPNATNDELIEAHAYAYGGCVIQDLGYYPFGNKDFSNLVHYVRSGDFVASLLQNANDLDEYAF